MKALSWLTCIRLFAFSSESGARGLHAGIRFTFARLAALLVLLSAGLASRAQTAHFAGAQMPPISGTSTMTGNNLSIAVDELAASAKFGQVDVGTAAPVISMQFVFDSDGTLGGISVLTQGTPGRDYGNAGSGTCTANTTYSAGQSCTVNVSFKPRFSGTRNGAVVLRAPNGDVIATAYLQGTGVGPQVNFLPGAQNVVLAAGLSDPTGVAVDGGGNVYVVDTNNNRVLKETLSAGAYTQSTVSSNVLLPNGVAVDGSGSVYIADTGNSRVLKETPTGSGGYTESIVANGAGNPSGIAVDGSGNVYVTDDVNGLVVKESPGAGGYVQTTIVSGLASPDGLAVDGSGNLYIADTNNNRVLKETLSGGAYTQTVLPSDGLTTPTGVAVDGTGNVYVVFGNNFFVLKETLSGSSYIPSSAVSDSNSPFGPFGVAVDSAGNLYIGDEVNNRVLREDFADPPSLAFANTAVGTTSSDSAQAVTVANNGNGTLTFPVPSTGNNPSIGPDFTPGSSGLSDCPLLTSESASPATLAPGTECQLSVSFAPTVSGSLMETLILTDNNLNTASPAYATQTIALAGTTVTQTAPSILWPAPASISGSFTASTNTSLTVQSKHK